MYRELVIRGARPEDFDELVVAIATAFGDEGNPWPRDHVAIDPNHRPELHRLCVVDKQIVSAMRIVCQDVRYGHAVLRHTGVGDVGTLPECRKHGYSTLVLRDAIAHMEGIGGHFSMLYTGIQPFYERLGWASLPLRDDRFSIPGSSPETMSEWEGEVVEFDSSLHLRGYRKLYNEFNATRTATTVRCDRYWELRCAGKPRDDVLVAVADGEVQASAVFWIDAEGRKALTVPEYAWRHGAEGALEELIAELIQRGQAAGVATLVFDFDGDEAGRAIASRLAEPIEGREWTALMFRIVDLQGLLNAALPELSSRVAAVPESAHDARLRLAWDAQSAVLALNDGELAVTDGSEEAAADLKLNSAEIIQLIFGEGATAVQEHLSAAPDREQSLARALFPGERIVVWDTDSF